MAKPLKVGKESCLACHSTPDRAPKSQILAYGSSNGFGWKLNEVGESGHFWPDFLPDGRAVLFTIFGGKGLVDSRVGLLDLDTRRYEALFEGAAPRYLHSGHILYYRGGVYRIVPFDLARRRVSGPETTVLPTVRRLHSLGDRESYVALGRGGVLAFVEGDSSLGEPLSRLTWVARDGRREDLPFEPYHESDALSLPPDGTRAAVSRVEQGQMQVHVYDLARGTGEAVTRAFWMVS